MIVYHAGFACGTTGQARGGVEGFDKFVADTALKLTSPLEVSIGNKRRCRTHTAGRR